MGRVVVSERETKHRIQILFDQPAEADTLKAECEQNCSTWEYYPSQELNRLIGLEQVKRFVHEIYAWLEVGRRRKEAGLSSEQQVLHMVYTGNPGTGKTTVARIMARLLQQMGVLSKGHLIEVERADLVGEYIGHTAQRTREQVKQALGGILFIDEAYSLARGGEKDFGKEAIDTLVKAMEDYKNDFILILAGYSLEMEHFLSSNPGLPSRFPVQLHFPDFTINQLMQIAEQMMQERQYQLTPIAQEKLQLHLLQCKQDHQIDFGNARYVRNLLEQSIRKQAVRLLEHLSPTREDLMAIQATDLAFRRQFH